ncbi:MAG: hypothetical protein NZ455_00695 [Bacteroidia bacterium]|nr:hypothetical protein [Bacteroidia bacterium]MDW8347217.1 hypothetical protein [Bacteroidia bacterium]
MRHAEGKPSGLVRSPSPTLSLLPRGWAGGAQHRQPVARRPCGHERMRNAHKGTPKKLKFNREN